MNNIPVKGGEDRITCELTARGYRFLNTSGYIISEVDAADVYKMATLMTYARDRGFEQGRKHVRDALGIGN